jgi:hypothetical protein
MKETQAMRINQTLQSDLDPEPEGKGLVKIRHGNRQQGYLAPNLKECS